MLDTEVDALLHVAVANDLEADDSNAPGGDVVDNAGLAVVELRRAGKQARKSKGWLGRTQEREPKTHLVGHTLLLSRVGLDVDDVSDLVDGQVRRKGDCALLCERQEAGRVSQ